MKIRIGTRGSDLALWQAHWVADQLTAAGCEVELDVMKTRGDRIDDVPLQSVEGKAFFTAEIENALLERRVDVAVHSHKDLPVEGPPGLTIAAVANRASTLERLVVRSEAFDADAAFLPIEHGARVGTSSPRRQAQIQALRPDLEILDLRGNVPTRVDRVRENRYDGILLAAAGLDRLALDTSDLRVVDLASDLLVPAPGQGALAVQVRAEDDEVRDLVRRTMHDDRTALAVAAERSLLALAGGGCNLALGAALERVSDGGGWRARVFRGPDATDPERTPRWATARADDPAEAAERALTRALAASASGEGPLEGLRVALTGAWSANSPLGNRLAELGADVVHEAVIRCESLADRDDSTALAPQVAELRPGDALAVTSRHAAKHLAGIELPNGVVVAAVGPTTARELAGFGVEADVVGKSGARELGRLLALEAGARVLHPCAEDALHELQGELDPRGVEVKRVELYRTVAETKIELDASVDARVYLSPSSVHACAAWEGAHAGTRTQRIALGRSTAQALADVGLDHAVDDRSSDSAAERVVRLLSARTRDTKEIR